MSDLVRASPVPGWYDDPAGSGQLRWWTGAGWTEHLAPKATPAPVAQVRDPLALESQTPRALVASVDTEYEPFASSRYTSVSSYSASAIRSPMPTSGSTGSVWLLAVLPILLLIPIAIVWSMASEELFVSPSLSPALALQTIGIGGGFIGLQAALVFLDRRSLIAKGAPAPSFLWWLLGPLAYLIARTVVLGREKIRSAAPLVVWLLANVVQAVGTVVIVFATLQQVLPTATITGLEQQIDQELTREGITGTTTVCPEDSPVFTIGAKFVCRVTIDGTTRGLGMEVTVQEGGTFVFFSTADPQIGS